MDGKYAKTKKEATMRGSRMITAISRGDIGFVEKHFNECVPKATKEEMMFDPCHVGSLLQHAISCGQEKIVEFILEQDMDFSNDDQVCQDISGEPLLIVNNAIRNLRSVKLIEKVIEAARECWNMGGMSFDRDVRDVKTHAGLVNLVLGDGPCLFAAVVSFRPDVLKMLIHKVKVNPMIEWGKVTLADFLKFHVWGPIAKKPKVYRSKEDKKKLQKCREMANVIESAIFKKHGMAPMLVMDMGTDDRFPVVAYGDQAIDISVSGLEGYPRAKEARDLIYDLLEYKKKQRCD